MNYSLESVARMRFFMSRNCRNRIRSNERDDGIVWLTHWIRYSISGTKRRIDALDVIIHPDHHSNVLWIDGRHQTIERFEPQFIDRHINDSIDASLRFFFRKNAPRYQYIPNDNDRKLAIQAITWPTTFLEYCMLYYPKRSKGSNQTR